MNTNKIPNTRGLAIAGLTAFLIGTGSIDAQNFVDPPEDKGAFANETVTFEVEPKVAGVAYQWLRAVPEGYVELASQTNKSLTLTNVGVDQVGLYACAITSGDQAEVTRAASLTVVVAAGSSVASDSGGLFFAFGSPLYSSGTSSDCPGSYAGYVTYKLPVAQGWGWAPSTNTTVHTASDITRTDTKIEYVGKYGDAGCAQTSVTVPHPTVSPRYRFGIYFPNNVPTTNYPILLEGFNL